MLNTAVYIFMPTCTAPRGKGKPKGNPVVRLNFIQVPFIFVNISPDFHINFCRCDNTEYITEKHFSLS